jgi:hypothetical protein
MRTNRATNNQVLPLPAQAETTTEQLGLQTNAILSLLGIGITTFLCGRYHGLRNNDMRSLGQRLAARIQTKLHLNLGATVYQAP